MERPIVVLGLLSGSSLDGLDVALCSFEGDRPDNIKWSCSYSQTVDFPPSLLQDLKRATKMTARELFALEHQFSIFCIEVINEIKSREDIPVIDYICSHGHTVYHFPEQGWTLQIGKGATISEHTQIPCITDVRANDIALGGQGAPIAPIVEKWLIPGFDFYFNLGGITNISMHKEEGILSFDSGPCNQVMNTFMEEVGKSYDDRGKLAATGVVHDTLLQEWLSVDYLSETIPKSLDNSWVKEFFTPMAEKYQLSLQDRLATVVEFIAVQSTKDVLLLNGESKGQKRAFLTGGGAHNDFLVARLSHHLSKINVTSIKPKDDMINFKEAMMISLVGYLRIKQIPNVIPTVTGSSKATIGGAVYIPAN